MFNFVTRKWPSFDSFFWWVLMSTTSVSTLPKFSHFISLAFPFEFQYYPTGTYLDTKTENKNKKQENKVYGSFVYVCLPKLSGKQEKRTTAGCSSCLELMFLKTSITKTSGCIESCYSRTILTGLHVVVHRDEHTVGWNFRGLSTFRLAAGYTCALFRNFSMVYDDALECNAR